MADKDHALPVRSQADGTDERLHVKIVDGVASPAVNQTQVDGDNNLHVEIHGDDPGGSDAVIKVSEDGAITPDGVYDATHNSEPGNVGIIVSSRNTTPGHTTQTLRTTGIQGSGSYDNTYAMDVSLHDEAGNPYSPLNPLPVTISVIEGGTNIHHPQASAVPLAVLGVENHDYTVTSGKTMQFWQFTASASGKIKAEVFVNGTSKAVYFNSVANPNIDIIFRNAVIVSATQVVRIAITNRDESAMDVYSTIIGTES